MPDRPLIVGVDPGGSETGVIARLGNVLHAATLVTKAAGQAPAEYLAEVLDTVAGHARILHAAAIVVEDVVAPTGRALDGELRPIEVTGILGTAKTVGALLTLPGVILVRPAGFGIGPLELYPAELVGPLERVGAGRRRHLRSAWDIAAAGELELRANLAAHRR